MKRQRIRPAVFLLAAEQLQAQLDEENFYSGSFCCHALDLALATVGDKYATYGAYKESLEYRLFERLFKPKNICSYDPWWGDTHSKKSQQQRINALLLAYEEAKKVR